MSDGAMEAAPLLREAMSLREKWMGRRVGGGTASPPAEPLTAAAAKELQYEMVDGIMRVAGESPRDAALFAGHSVADFIVDTDRVAAIRGTGPAVSYSYQRLRLLEAQYNVHCMLNGEMETKEMMAIPHRDFYNVRKVDTHVHHSASMNVSRAQNDLTLLHCPLPRRLLRRRLLRLLRLLRHHLLRHLRLLHRLRLLRRLRRLPL